MKILKEKFSAYKLKNNQLNEIKGGGPVEYCQRNCIGLGGHYSIRRCMDACAEDHAMR